MALSRSASTSDKRHKATTPSSPLRLQNMASDCGMEVANRQPSKPHVTTWLQEYGLFDASSRHDALTQLIESLASTVNGRIDLNLLQLHISPLLTKDFINQLPWLVAVHILSYLDKRSLSRAACVCHGWRAISSADSLWKPLCSKIGLFSRLELSWMRDKTAHPTWKQLYIDQGRLNESWKEKPIVSPPTRKQCHGHNVVTVLAAAGENHVISCSDDHSLKVWQVRPPKVLHTLVGHRGGVWSCATEGTTVVSGSTDHDLRVWDFMQGKCIHQLSGHTSTVRCVSVKGNTIVSGSRDSTVRVWDRTTGKIEHVLEGHSDAVRCIDFDGKTIVSGSYDFVVRVWNRVTGRCVHELVGHLHKIYSIQLSSKYVVSGSLDATIRVWDLETGDCCHVLRGHSSITGTLYIRGDTLISASTDSTLRVWDLQNGKCLYEMGSNLGPDNNHPAYSGPGHRGPITDIAVSDKHIISCSDDGTVKLWNFADGTFVRTLVDINVAYPDLNKSGIVWRVFCNKSSMVCACGSRVNELDQMTALAFIDFTPESIEPSVSTFNPLQGVDRTVSTAVSTPIFL
eukprot:m.33210 g.33210  ORF g.33210 m.33210 type:complete len:569 (-) comp16774_c0_seq1:338-2044(-)